MRDFGRLTQKQLQGVEQQPTQLIDVSNHVQSVSALCDVDGLAEHLRIRSRQNGDRPFWQAMRTLPYFDAARDPPVADDEVLGRTRL